jgi:hypothetical protein
MSINATSPLDYDAVQESIKKVNRELQKVQPRHDAADKQRAIDWLNRHRGLRALARESHAEFVVAYIQREQTRASVPVGEHPHDGHRDDPLCTCLASNCPLKQGRLPRELDDAETLSEGIKAFRSRPFHDGEPVVLSEARQVYNQALEASKEVHDTAFQILTHGADAPDEDVAAPDGALAVVDGADT